MSTHELTFGSLDLASGLSDDADGFWFEVLADGFAPGSPEAVKAVVATLMRDGDDERIARYGNRTFTFRVAVRAPDSESLHRGEAALVAELGGRNTISWMPPDGYGGLTVFDVLNSTMDPEFDDFKLLRAPLEMVYSITATCEPWPRSAVLSTATGSVTDAGGLLTVPVGGSVRTVGSLTVSPANPSGEGLIYCDPAMLSTTYRPNDSATWQYAPAGRYVLYAKFATTPSPGHVIQAEATRPGGDDDVIRTRIVTGRTWNPVGEFTLGGNRDGLVGAVTIVANNITPDPDVAASGLRLFRIADDTSLLHVGQTVGAAEIVLDIPSADFPQGGLWYDGGDATQFAHSYEFPVLAPPSTALWVDAFNTGGGGSTVTASHHPRWHTFAAGS